MCTHGCCMSAVLLNMRQWCTTDTYCCCIYAPRTCWQLAGVLVQVQPLDTFTPCSSAARCSPLLFAGWLATARQTFGGWRATPGWCTSLAAAAQVNPQPGWSYESCTCSFLALCCFVGTLFAGAGCCMTLPHTRAHTTTTTGYGWASLLHVDPSVCWLGLLLVGASRLVGVRVHSTPVGRSLCFAEVVGVVVARLVAFGPVLSDDRQTDRQTHSKSHGMSGDPQGLPVALQLVFVCYQFLAGSAFLLSLTTDGGRLLCGQHACSPSAAGQAVCGGWCVFVFGG